MLEKIQAMLAESFIPMKDLLPALSVRKSTIRSHQREQVFFAEQVTEALQKDPAIHIGCSTHISVASTTSLNAE